MARLADVMAELLRFYSSGRVEVHPAGAEWDRADLGSWSIVVTPHGEDEVSRTMQVAERFVVPVKVGGTQSIGRPKLRPGGVLRIDTTSMGRLLAIDHLSGLVTVQSGTSIAVLESRLKERKLSLGWSTAWSEPQTLGAVLAGAVEDRWGPLYGSAQGSVRALGMVLPDGSRVWSRLAPRRATGPDLTSIALGTMGRLAIIVSASLRVVARPASRVVLSGETDRPSAALRSVIRLLREGPLPHLVEINGRPDGRATVLLSLWGTKVDVADAAARAATTLGLHLSDMTTLPPPVMFDAAATRIRAALPSAVRVLEQWEASAPRRPIRVDRFTSHSAQIACPDSGPCAIGLDREPPLGRPSRVANQAYLQRLKAALDEHNLLGSL